MSDLTNTTNIINASLIEKIVYGMISYKNAIEVFTDKEYDNLKSSLPKASVYNYINWDDCETLPLYRNIVEKYNLQITSNPITLSEEEILNNKIKGKYASSKSMIMTNEVEELIRFLQNVTSLYYHSQKDVEVNISYKLDGWHVRNFFDENNKLFLSQSKAKDTNNVLVFTDTMESVIYKNNTDITINEPVCIQGELCLNKVYLQYLRNKYNKPFKNVRNSIRSFMTEHMDNSDKLLPTFFAFNIIKENGEPLLNKISDTYSYLYSSGFNIPPNITIKSPYNSSFEYMFKMFMEKCSTVYKKMEDVFSNTFMFDFESDGLVVQANDYNIAQDINLTNSNGNYSTGMLAFKGGIWGKEYYEAIVKEIIFASSKQNREPILILEPVDTGYSTITRCEINNINNLLKNKIDIKSRVLISVHSRQIIQFEKTLS